ncbi:MAG: hypothetical protein IPM85_17230 [Chitinophagaceae bacterium]|nr:hypothetical protein [Chitinophagaceae bacterium]
MALVSNARKIYYSGQRPGITTLYLLQYKTGNDLSIQVADSIRWPAVSELAGGLRQLPGGAIRLFLFHKEADEVAGLYEQYSLDNNYKFKRIVQTKAVHKKFGYNTDGVLAAAQLDWYYIILNGLPDREGNLVFANQSYIKRIRNDKLETLAGTYYPGNRNGDVREQVCNNAKLLWIDTNNQVEFLNCHRVASLQGKDFWELKNCNGWNSRLLLLLPFFFYCMPG